MKKLLFIVLLFSMSYSQISSQISSRTFTGEFPVTINGGNFKPGVYYVYPAMRVLDVLKRAGDSLFLEDIPRDIKVDGVSIDLFQYIFKNDQSQNPVVTPGMNIYAEFPTERVTIKGDFMVHLAHDAANSKTWEDRVKLFKNKYSKLIIE